MEVVYKGKKYRNSYIIEAYIENNNAGSILFREGQQSIIIGILKVSAEFRRNKIASTLMGLVERFARKHGKNMIEGCLPRQQVARAKARKFYSAYGCQLYVDHDEEKFIKFVTKESEKEGIINTDYEGKKGCLQHNTEGIEKLF